LGNLGVELAADVLPLTRPGAGRASLTSPHDGMTLSR
jgi:hypothetical protein